MSGQCRTRGGGVPIALATGVLAVGIGETLRRQFLQAVDDTVKRGESLDSIVVAGFLAGAQRAVAGMIATQQRAAKKARAAEPSPEEADKTTATTNATPATPATDNDVALLLRLVDVYGPSSWSRVATNFPEWTARQCAARWEEQCPVKAFDVDRALVEKDRHRVYPPTGPTPAQQVATARVLGTLLKRAFRRLCQYATGVQRDRLHLLDTLLRRIPNDKVLEFLKGGHARVYDSGAFYVDVVTTEGSHPRLSSHYPQNKSAPHYGLTIRVPKLPVMHLLTGVIRRNQQKVTWIQLESSPMPSLFELFRHEGVHRNVTGIVAHARDYFAHRRTRKQYGPIGSSLYTEKGTAANVIKVGYKSPSKKPTASQRA